MWQYFYRWNQSTKIELITEKTTNTDIQHQNFYKTLGLTQYVEKSDPSQILMVRFDGFRELWWVKWAQVAFRWEDVWFVPNQQA